MTFISFSCLIALDRTSGLMLNASAKGRHLFFILDIMEKCGLFTIKYDVSCKFFFVDFLYHGKKFNSILPSVRVLSCMWIGFCQIHMFCLLCWSYGFLFFCAKTAWYCFDKFYLVKLFNSSSMNLYDLLIFCWEFLHCFLAILLQLTIFSLLLIVFSW